MASSCSLLLSLLSFFFPFFTGSGRPIRDSVREREALCCRWEVTFECPPPPPSEPPATMDRHFGQKGRCSKGSAPCCTPPLSSCCSGQPARPGLEGKPRSADRTSRASRTILPERSAEYEATPGFFLFLSPHFFFPFPSLFLKNTRRRSDANKVTS